MAYYEVIYYAKFCCRKVVEADSGKEAKARVYDVEAAKGGLHQYTPHLAKEVEPEWIACPDCGGDGYLPPSGEYCQPVCMRCNCTGLILDALLK